MEEYGRRLITVTLAVDDDGAVSSKAKAPLKRASGSGDGGQAEEDIIKAPVVPVRIG